MSGHLIVLSGLPGVGKSEIARDLAARHKAVWLRVDAIEAGLRASALKVEDALDGAYHAAWRLAADHLKLGLCVIGDAVNPVLATRAGWLHAARTVGARASPVEVICSDRATHRARVEARHAADGEDCPDWPAVAAHRFVPWTSPRLVIDTYERSPEAAARHLAEALGLIRQG